MVLGPYFTWVWQTNRKPLPYLMLTRLDPALTWGQRPLGGSGVITI